MKIPPFPAALACLACLACGSSSTEAPPIETPSANAPSGGVATAAGGPAVQLDAATCEAPAPAQKKWVTGDYAKYERFAIVCPVRRPGGAIGLYVLSIDALDLDRSLPADALAPTLPEAALVLPDGQIVGKLPYAYPADPPVTLDITFSDWTDALPGAVRVFVKDPTVSGDRALPPLVWRADRRQYVEEDAPR